MTPGGGGGGRGPGGGGSGAAWGCVWADAAWAVTGCLVAGDLLLSRPPECLPAGDWGLWPALGSLGACCPWLAGAAAAGIMRPSGSRVCTSAVRLLSCSVRLPSCMAWCLCSPLKKRLVLLNWSDNGLSPGDPRLLPCWLPAMLSCRSSSQGSRAIAGQPQVLARKLFEKSFVRRSKDAPSRAGNSPARPRTLAGVV